MILRDRLSCRMSWVLLISTLAASLAAGCGQRASQAFSELVDEFLEGYFAAHPVTATSIGAHEFDHALDPMSEEAIGAEIERLRAFLTRIESLAARRLDRDDRIDLAILKDKIEAELLELEEIQGWRHDPLIYTNLVGNGIYLLLARDFASLEDRLESAIARMEQIPRLVDEAKRNLDNPSQVHTETAIKQNRGNIDLIRTDLARASEQAPALQDRVGAASTAAVQALEDFQGFLENDLLPRSQGDFRLGPDLYRKKLACTLQTDLTPEEMLKRAWAEFLRVRREMYEISRELYGEYFPGSRLRDGERDYEEHVIKQVLGRIADEHPTESNILAFIKETLSDLEAFIEEQDLLALDRSQTLEVVWMPEFSRGVAIAGLESPGPLERHLQAFYYVMPIPEDWTDEEADSFFREYNNFMTQILTIHEAMPGHYVQIYHANRHPSIVRQVFASGTFVEGWAVYTERMMVEAGYMDHDPRLKLQQLKFYLRTVINAILDAEIHAGQMTEEQAMELMSEGGFQEASEARGKWTRARLTATQLATYFVGLQEVLELRDHYARMKGDAFSLKGFHQAVLAHGSPAPKYLEQILIRSGD